MAQEGKEVEAPKDWRGLLGGYRKEKGIESQEWGRFLDEYYGVETEPELIKGLTPKEEEWGPLTKERTEEKESDKVKNDELFARNVEANYEFWKSGRGNVTNELEPREKHHPRFKSDQPLDSDAIIREGLKMQERSDMHAAEEAKKKRQQPEPEGKPEQHFEKPISLWVNEKGLNKLSEEDADKVRELAAIWDLKAAIYKIKMKVRDKSLLALIFEQPNGREIELETHLLRQGLQGVFPLNEKDDKNIRFGPDPSSPFLVAGTPELIAEDLFSRIRIDNKKLASAPKIVKEEVGK